MNHPRPRSAAPLLALFLTGLAIAGCVVRVQEHHYVSGSSNLDTDLPVRRPIDLTAADPATLIKLESTDAIGNVNIVSSPSITRYRITGTLREKTENEATIDLTPTGPRIASSTEPRAKFADITIEVPPGTDLDVRTSTGQVTARDLAATNSVDLRSSYGNVSLENAAPIKTLSLRSSSGKVSADRIASFRDATFKSAYGDIDLTDLAGDSPDAKLDANTSSGTVRLKNVRSCTLNAKSSYGSVTLESAADLPAATLATSSGNVSASHLDRTGDLSLSSSYGQATLAQIPSAKSVAVKCSSGNITLTAVSAPKADLRTSYGNISLDSCAFDTVDTHTSSGRLKQKDVRIGSMNSH